MSFRVTKQYPKAPAIIIIAKTGPVIGGTMSTLVITAYDSKAAIDRAIALNAYDMYTKALVLSILENAERTNILSKVSTNIIPMTKKQQALELFEPRV
jgi:hypothetical protein